jgi:succinylglutamate desuccinylase
MQQFLARTLARQIPQVRQGRTPQLSWQWQGHGLLELVPHQTPRCDLVLSAAIHGNETAPVELLMTLLEELLSGTRPLAVRLLLILGNPAAMAAGCRYQQLDLNRLFGGRYQQLAVGSGDSSEAVRARELEQALQEFWPQAPDRPRFHYDLHTAIRGSLHTRFALLPSQPRPYSAELLAWLPQAGISALVQHNRPSGTFSHYSSERFAAASCTLELGKVRPFGANDLGEFAGVAAALASLIGGELPLGVTAPEGEMQVFRVSQELRKLSADFRLAFDEQVLNFTPFAQGCLLAEDGDTRYRVQASEEFLLFPNAGVRPGLRAGLMLVPQPFRALLD